MFPLVDENCARNFFEAGERKQEENGWKLKPINSVSHQQISLCTSFHGRNSIYKIRQPGEEKKVFKQIENVLGLVVVLHCTIQVNINSPDNGFFDLALYGCEVV